MKVETKVLDEVVVVGYGVQKKVNLPGSVTSINFADQTEGRHIMSVSSALSGLAAGMNVTQASGQPGDVYKRQAYNLPCPLFGSRAIV